MSWLPSRDRFSFVRHLDYLIEEPPLYQLEQGMIEIPQRPVLGLAIDEEAIERYRIP